MKQKEIKHLQKKLIHWYNTDHRQLPWRETDNPYHIWVSEVMLQQTQVKTVLPYYHKFLDYFPNLKELAAADLQAVLKIWEGLGYYARARNLHRAAQIVMEIYQGNIPDNWKDFKKLPGVGDYIASAVQSIAFHQSYVVVDGNVKRVLARLFQIDSPVNKPASYKIFKEVADQLIYPSNPGIFNQAIMELGAMICKPKDPECDICPISSFCLSYQKKTTNQYPKRIKTEPVPQYHLVAGVIDKNGQVLIAQRKPDGLLGGLWEFPGGKVGKGERPEDACIREIKATVNLSVGIVSFITRVRHTYTHFKIVVDLFQCKYISGKIKLNGPEDYRWIMLHESEQYPFHKAHHKFIPLLEK